MARDERCDVIRRCRVGIICSLEILNCRPFAARGRSLRTYCVPSVVHAVYCNVPRAWVGLDCIGSAAVAPAGRPRCPGSVSSPSPLAPQPSALTPTQYSRHTARPATAPPSRHPAARRDRHAPTPLSLSACGIVYAMVWYCMLFLGHTCIAVKSQKEVWVSSRGCLVVLLRRVDVSRRSLLRVVVVK